MKQLLQWAAPSVLSLLLCLCARSYAQGDGVEAARKLHEQAAQLYAMGKYRDAVPIAERALQAREAALGGEHLDTAASMRTLVQLYRLTGANSKAESLCKRALEIREKLAGMEHPATAESLSDLGFIYFLSADYAKAESLQTRALAIRDKVLGPEHPDTAASLSNLGRLYHRMGLYAKGEPLARRALAIREKVFGPEHPDTAKALQYLANLNLSSGAYAKAELLYTRALSIQEKVQGAAHPDTAEALMSLAIVYENTRAYSKGIQLLKRAIGIWENARGAENRTLASMLSNLALLYQGQGDYAAAEPLYQRSLAISEKLLDPEHPNVASTQENLAGVYSILGASERAEPLYQSALAIYEAVFGPEHPDTADALSNLGILYRHTASYAKAESLHQRALQIHEKSLGTEHPRTANSLLCLGLVYWAKGELTKALPLLQRAQNVNARSDERFLLSGSESRKQAYLDNAAEAVFRDISFSLSTRSSSVTLGLTSIWQYKSRALDAVTDSVARLRKSVRAEDRALFEQLAQVANDLSTLTYQGTGSLAGVAYRTRVNELSRQQDALETQLAKRSSQFRSEVAPLTLAAVRSAMPADAVLVEWLRYRPFDPHAKSVLADLGAPRYVAYVLRRSGDPVAIDLGTAEEIERLVQEFRLAVSDPARTDVLQQAAALSRKLIAPLRSNIGGARYLLLSPDGALNLVPVAALLDERGEYLAKRFEITYLTSGRDLLRIAAAGAVPSSKPVVLANPNYGRRQQFAQLEHPESMGEERSAELDRGGLVFRSLPGTATEAAAIAQLLHGAGPHIFTGDQASEANLKRLHGPQILHLATHGFFLGDQAARRALLPPAPADRVIENPLLRSGLALAGANLRRSGAEDGILTALEASRLDLRGTALVVLSACETGIGEARSGDGIMGLRRGLLLAGAQSQIASLWKVADLPTKELMVKFYQHLLRGEGRSAALRRAQREMLAEPMQSHPYYWAGFVAIGDWRPLSFL